MCHLSPGTAVSGDTHTCVLSRCICFKWLRHLAPLAQKLCHVKNRRLTFIFISHTYITVRLERCWKITFIFSCIVWTLCKRSEKHVLASLWMEILKNILKISKQIGHNWIMSLIFPFPTKFILAEFIDRQKKPLGEFTEEVVGGSPPKT